MSNAAVGLDLSAVTGATAYSVWVPFSEGCEVKIRYVSRAELREIANKATKVSFDPKSHQKFEEVDRVKWDQLLGAAAVLDWTGFREGDEPYVCSPENIRTLMTNWSVFAKLVGDVCVDIEVMAAAEKESERKNSETGSSPGKTTQASTAKTAEKLKP